MVEKAHKRLNILQNYFKKLACGVLLLSVFCSSQAHALALISDEETEIFLHQTLRPVFAAAGVTFYPGQIYVVNDNELNAFVSDGNRMFVNIGTIIAADTQNELTGVLAHETGHIQGGHILRHKIRAKEVQTFSLASMLVGGIAGLASGRADLSIAAILGSQSSAINSMLTYQMSEERSADEAAVNLLQKINQSPKGLANFLDKIKQRNKMQGIAEQSYYRTHPMTDERLAFVKKAAQLSKAPAKGKQEKEFLRVKAKLFAFTNEPKQTFIKYPLSDKSVPARYAHTIAWFKQLKMEQALSSINDLIKEEPNNPYFYELKGQMMLETGKIAEAQEAYESALKLNPNSSLFKLNLVQAMIENSPTEEQVGQIITMLNQVLIFNNQNPYAWLMLARAYGMKNDNDNSSYAAAEFSFLTGDIATAQKHAQKVLDTTKAADLRLKADDLLLRIKQIKKENNI